MYIPFLAKQKTNAWQLAVLPCVFGMLFWFSVWPAFDLKSYINVKTYFGQVAIVALLGVAVALLGFVLSGGLRACAIGLCLFMAYMLYCDRQRTALCAALAAFVLVLLVRVCLPKKVLNTDARANFRSFFWIAGLGLGLFLGVAALFFLLGLRK